MRLAGRFRLAASGGYALLGLATWTDGATPVTEPSQPPDAWREEISRIVWIAYSPTRANPLKGIEATVSSLSADLVVLRRAGFTGLVTYGSSGVIGRELPAIAAENGFRGLIIGVWNPESETELAIARAAAGNSIVRGYCVGNEGLDKRYTFSGLAASIESLRKATSLPVTTTEELEDYESKELLRLGDWVFPNVHPYFHRRLEPPRAVAWTLETWAKLTHATDRIVWFKEVGLPSAGKETLSEENQMAYYEALAKSPVRFVYFEAFDQPWKTHLLIEPHWGLFRSDRSPKLLADRLEGATAHLVAPNSTAPAK